MPTIEELYKSKQRAPTQDTKGKSIQELYTTKEIERGEGSLLTKAVEMLDRPGAGVRSAVFDLAQKARAGTLTPTERLTSIAPFWVFNPTARAAFMRGLTEGAPRSTQLWKQMGVRGVPFLGFATDVASDPLMYGGYSAITKGIGKIARPITQHFLKPGTQAALRGLEKIPYVGEKVAAAKDIVPAITDRLRNWFVTKTGIKELGKIIDKHTALKKYRTMKEFHYGVKLQNVVNRIARKYKLKHSDVEAGIATLTESPGTIENILLQRQLPGIPMVQGVQGLQVPQEMVTVAKALRQHFSHLITQELKAGVPIHYFAGGRQGLLYFPRIPARDVQRYISMSKKSGFGRGRKVWDVMMRASKQRGTGDWTLAEVNQFFAKHGVPSLGGKQFEQFFMQNPAYASVMRGVEHAKTVTSAGFYDDVINKFGMPQRVAKKVGKTWYKGVSTDLIKKYPKFKGMVFDPEVLNEINRVHAQYINPEMGRVFRPIYDRIINMWKRWTLAPFPKYHLRNMVGNLWNNYLAGVLNPMDYGRAQALQVWRKYRSNPGMKNFAMKNLAKFGFDPQQADDIIMRMEQLGVVGRGWYAADITKSIQQQMQRRGLIKSGMAVGTTIENNARIAHYLNKVKKGLSSDDAALSVKKFLFDYDDLTYFEKQIMKRMFPFYTWTRKNIPLQIENLITQPEKYAPITKAITGRDPKELLRLKYTRPDIYERLPIEMRTSADTITYIPLEGLIPATDLTKMVRPQELFAELLNPYIRGALELGFNKSLYFESEIQRYPGETQELLRMELPVKIKYAAATFLPQARMINYIDRFIRKRRKGESFTPAEHAIYHTLTTIYKTSITDLRDRAMRHLKSKLNDLQAGARWAKKNAREKEYKRVMKTYRRMKEELRRLQ